MVSNPRVVYKCSGSENCTDTIQRSQNKYSRTLKMSDQDISSFTNQSGVNETVSNLRELGDHWLCFNVNQAFGIAYLEIQAYF